MKFTLWGIFEDNQQTCGIIVEVPEQSTTHEVLMAGFREVCQINDWNANEELKAQLELGGDPAKIHDEQLLDGIFPRVRFTDIFLGEVKSIWSSDYYAD